MREKFFGAFSTPAMFEVLMPNSATYSASNALMSYNYKFQLLCTRLP